MKVKDGRGRQLRITGYTERHVYYTFTEDHRKMEHCSALRWAFDNWVAILEHGDERFQEAGQGVALRHAIFSKPMRGHKPKWFKRGRGQS